MAKKNIRLSLFIVTVVCFTVCFYTSIFAEQQMDLAPTEETEIQPTSTPIESDVEESNESIQNSTIEQNVEVSEMKLNQVQPTLQDLIANATAGDTIQLEAKTYSEDLDIDKAIHLKGVTGAIVTGNITVRNDCDLFLESVQVVGNITSNDAKLTMDKSEVVGLISIHLSSMHQVSITNSKLHYNIPGNSEAAIRVISMDNSRLYGDDFEIKNNTFIHQGEGDYPIVSWPFTTVNHQGVVADDRLNLSENFWKKSNGDLLLYDEIKVEGNVKFACEMKILPRDRMLGYWVPREENGKQVQYKKGSSSVCSGNSCVNNNGDYIEAGDYLLILYGRNFMRSGLVNPIDFAKKSTFLVTEFLKEDYTKFETPVAYPFRATSAFYKDSSYRTPYVEADFSSGGSGTKFTGDDGGNIYYNYFSVESDIFIKSNDMVSYEGNSPLLSSRFPAVNYSMKIYNYFSTKPTLEENEMIDFTNARFQLSYGSGLLMVPKLKAENCEFMPNLGSEYCGYEPSVIDPDGDDLPFIDEFVMVNQSRPSLTNQTGAYITSVQNKDNIDVFSYKYFFDNSPNKLFTGLLGDAGVSALDTFRPIFTTGELYIRAVSDTITVEPVTNNFSGSMNTAQAKIEGSAVYYDSSKETITKSNVYLLNDLKEPNTTMYNKMLDLVKNHEATKNKSYEYHFLSLLNKDDGNNVVTTSSAKTVFIPYPTNYKPNTALTIMFFDNYQRMPNDDIVLGNIKIIADNDIVKKDTGYEVTLRNDMGPIMVAYTSKASTPSPTSIPPVEPTTDPSPTPSPTIQPTVLPKPSVKPTVKPSANPSTKPTSEPAVDAESSPSSVPTVNPKPSQSPPSESSMIIGDSDTPFRGLAEFVESLRGAAWALVNLLCWIVGLLLTVILLLSKRYKKPDEDEKDEAINKDYQHEDNEDEEKLRKRRYKIGCVIVTVISIVVFFLTEDMRLPMVLFDWWTLLMVILLLITIVLFIFGRRWHEEEEEEDEEGTKENDTKQ